MSKKTEKIRQCEVCNDDFVVIQDRQKFCSKKCKRKSYYLRNQERILLQKRLAHKRPVQESKTCIRCGGTFVPVRSDQIYCSYKCRHIAAKHRYRPLKSYPMKKCKICGKDFQPIKYDHIHCSRSCYENRYVKCRKAIDPNYKLAQCLRDRLNKALKGNQKTGSAIRDLGCSIDFLRQHLESLFQPGMSWDNWSLHGWHIDHMQPLSSFDLTNREQLLKACHYTNLQPLWAEENLKKSDQADWGGNV